MGPKGKGKKCPMNCAKKTNLLSVCSIVPLISSVVTRLEWITLVVNREKRDVSYRSTGSLLDVWLVDLWETGINSLGVSIKRLKYIPCRVAEPIPEKSTGRTRRVKD